MCWAWCLPEARRLERDHQLLRNKFALKGRGREFAALGLGKGGEKLCSHDHCSFDPKCGDQLNPKNCPTRSVLSLGGRPSQRCVKSVIMAQSKGGQTLRSERSRSPVGQEENWSPELWVSHPHLGPVKAWAWLLPLSSPFLLGLYHSPASQPHLPWGGPASSLQHSSSRCVFVFLRSCFLRCPITLSCHSLLCSPVLEQCAIHPITCLCVS